MAVVPCIDSLNQTGAASGNSKRCSLNMASRGITQQYVAGYAVEASSPLLAITKRSR